MRELSCEKKVHMLRLPGVQRNWSDGEALIALKYYCLYIIVLAMNGTSEAFLHAVATEDQIKHSNDSLLVFSVIYITTNVLLILSAGARQTAY
ncbi:protein RFT1 homolog isoform X3 [Mangifera indica]|uniref:protein RFT1 homolog isoform X3 n=1 Tax=Mangifera indica TaxID=29780 RepID=UPI001CFBCE68|nr:protein RFT1 homolog isoform X3 [Mangifera indica]